MNLAIIGASVAGLAAALEKSLHWTVRDEQLVPVRWDGEHRWGQIKNTGYRIMARDLL
jgi:thioredoxin reductase